MPGSKLGQGDPLKTHRALELYFREHFPQGDLEFFTMHATEDERHFWELCRVIEREVRSEQDYDVVSLGIEVVVKSDQVFWEGLVALNAKGRVAV